jgi:hypothetical protein
MRGSSPRMTFSKSVMAGLDPAICLHRITKGSAIGASEVLIHTVFVRV